MADADSIEKDLFGDSDEESDEPTMPDSPVAKSTAVEDELFGRDEDDSDQEPQATPANRPTIPDGDASSEDEPEHVGQTLRMESRAVNEDAPLPSRDGARRLPTQAGLPQEFVLPRVPRPAPGSQLAITRLPNILGIQPRQFVADAYDYASELAELQQEMGGGSSAAAAAARSQNMIRWRVVPSQTEGGPPVIQSNARLVRWSDGSTQLLIGGGDVLDVAVSSTTRKEHAYIYQTEPAQGVLHCHGRLTQKLVFRPTSLRSASHRKLTQAVHKSSGVSRQVKAKATVSDPQAQKEKRSREREELIRQRQKMQQHQQRDSAGYRRRAPPMERMDRDFLESAAAGGSLRALKALGRRGDSGSAGDSDSGSEGGEVEYQSSSDDGAAAAAAASRKRAAPAVAAAVGSEEEEEEEVSSEGEEEEEEEIMAPASKRRRRAVIGGDDDDDDDGSDAE